MTARHNHHRVMNPPLLASQRDPAATARQYHRSAWGHCYHSELVEHFAALLACQRCPKCLSTLDFTVFGRRSVQHQYDSAPQSYRVAWSSCPHKANRLRDVTWYGALDLIRHRALIWHGNLASVRHSLRVDSLVQHLSLSGEASFTSKANSLKGASS